MAALCRLAAGPLDIAAFALVASMWAAMVLAMMLPSAAPMILTYAEIADTAARKGERVVSPLVLAAGYTARLARLAALAAAAQLLSRTSDVGRCGYDVRAARLFSGAIFIAAGPINSPTLKHACLSAMPAPFPFFFANWTTTSRAACSGSASHRPLLLGCCWAMMLVMFAAGVMNVVWMAALGIVMTAEKLGTGKRRELRRLAPR